MVYKILVVEDEDIIRQGIVYMVDWAGMDCVVVGQARNGEEGIEKISMLEPDIVLLDINMPIKSGIELLQECEGKHIFSSIILSGYDDFQYAKNAIRFGVSDYLLKPVIPAELMAAIEKAKSAIAVKKRYKEMKSRFTRFNEISLVDLNKWHSIEHPSKHVTRMVEYIQENYKEKIIMEDLSDELEMSATYLNRKLKESTNYTFNEYLNAYRIQKAIELIKKGEDKISIIALEVGYSNYRYFITVFKKYTNALPSDFVEYYHQLGATPPPLN